MKHYTKKNKPITVVSKVVCDLCGKTSKDPYSWSTDAFYLSETEAKVQVRQKEGNFYPDGGWGTVYDIDLCPVCFKERLVPWLRSQGAEIKESEWDY